jgi:hypothetical protein
MLHVMLDAASCPQHNLSCALISIDLRFLFAYALACACSFAAGLSAAKVSNPSVRVLAECPSSDHLTPEHALSFSKLHVKERVGYTKNLAKCNVEPGKM